MAHVQGSHIGLWKPQSLSIDKIDSKKMFVDNIDLLEEFALSILKRSSLPVTTLAELRAIDTSDITMYADGTTIMVKSNGIYFFDRTNTSIDNGTTIIAPTVGGGRWISDHTFLGKLAFKDSLTKTDIGLGNVPNVSTNDQTPTFTQASTLTNIASGEKASTLFGKIMKAIADLISHLANKSNPHAVSKIQVGLGNVDNTSDANKPVSTAQATAIADAKAAGTDAQTNLNTHTNNKANPHSVTKAQVGLGNVDNTSDLDKPISTATQTQLNNKAPSKFISAYTEVNSWNAMNTFIDNTLVYDMTNNSIKHVAILLTADIGPFFHAGSVHFTIHRVNENYGYVIASKYASTPNEVRFYSRCKAIGGWGDWVTYPAILGITPASVESF